MISPVPSRHHEHHEHYEHYEHYDSAMIERLDGAWGHVDRAINEKIATLLPDGARVLDLGCGFGSLANRLSKAYRVVGVDPLLDCLAAASDRYPGLATLCGSAVDLPIRSGVADVVVLRDVLHHLADETPIGRLFQELKRVGVRVAIVVDPNPNPVLLAARKLLGHVDPVCGPREATGLFEAAGFRVERIEYDLLFSLPLSGGYVGPVLLPRWRWLWALLLWKERLLCRVLDGFGLSRWLCWRYYLVAASQPR